LSSGSGIVFDGTKAGSKSSALRKLAFFFSSPSIKIRRPLLGSITAV
ncbi:hypothetical protein T12_12262, partial [Trichinella patagoniensis]